MARSEAEIAYAAGFFDGEGSVQIAHRAARPNHYAMRAVVANADRSIIEWFKQQWGGSIFHKQFALNKNYRDSFQWQLSTLQALVFLQELFPFLRVKKQQAALGIECQLISKRWGGGRAVGHLGKPPEITARQVLLHSELAKLNKRGRRGLK